MTRPPRYKAKVTPMTRVRMPDALAASRRNLERVAKLAKKRKLPAPVPSSSAQGWAEQLGEEL